MPSDRESGVKKLFSPLPCISFSIRRCFHTNNTRAQLSCRKLKLN